MAHIKQHIKDCEELLGDGFKGVHEFLDMYTLEFPIQIFRDYHRTFLHNTYGLEIIYIKWGVTTKDAGIAHLCRDYCGEGDISWLFEAPNRINRILTEFNNPENCYYYSLLKQ